MKKFIYCLIFSICFINFTSCSKDDEFNNFIDDNSPCYIDYFMNKYYIEYRFNGNVILDKRDIKKFDIHSTKIQGNNYVVLNIDYYEKNNYGYISSILNTLNDQIRNEFKSDDIFNTPDNSISIICKHSHCLNKYKKYNIN